MTALHCAMLGLAGATVIEVFQFAGDLYKSRRWPWRKRNEIAPLMTAVVLRLGGSFILAFVLGADGKIDSASASAAVGMAAPVVTEKLMLTARAIAGGLGGNVDAGK
ncbi:hypothetical protein Val02_04120 [Virgisporangium aliadipatigenens]|uniref:Uncharacterized protein n=1 Tax=Virgisporangium aliadipatigenens TaxID=741659 RepID=A0A8J4DN70_9ACTN|nr:hypothetical protein [Virgisporangium aliadipatigenens]GIJ43526.1 hypothetical protein Val02_04120 [Virgisporangium aliadipatigenens]